MVGMNHQLEQFSGSNSPDITRKRRLIRRATGMAATGVLLFWACSVALVFFLRFVPPATSAFMLARVLRGKISGEKEARIAYQWGNLEQIAPEMALAVIAAEDQTFPEHRGFDFNSIKNALHDRETGGRLRGASTISQQVAKNLFLWQGKSYLRKGLEAYFTVLIELLWPKRRIVEVYLNIAEFGDRVYGVTAAAQVFWGKSADRLTKRECALLAAVLPNPKLRRAQAPSAFVARRAKKIETQMANLGGVRFLKRIQ